MIGQRPKNPHHKDDHSANPGTPPDPSVKVVAEMEHVKSESEQTQSELERIATELDQAKLALQQAQEAERHAQESERRAEESERRALADYTNLVRRTQEDRVKMVKFASREAIAAILEPLAHLELAAQQLHDKGVDMVVASFYKVLQDQGLTELNVMHKPFDPHTMEAVDKVSVQDEKQHDKVVEVVRKGYQLYGEVIQQAKVKVGVSE